VPSIEFKVIALPDPNIVALAVVVSVIEIVWSVVAPATVTSWKVGVVGAATSVI